MVLGTTLSWLEFPWVALPSGERVHTLSYLPHPRDGVWVGPVLMCVPVVLPSGTWRKNGRYLTIKARPLEILLLGRRKVLEGNKQRSCMLDLSSATSPLEVTSSCPFRLWGAQESLPSWVRGLSWRNWSGKACPLPLDPRPLSPSWLWEWVPGGSC